MGSCLIIEFEVKKFHVATVGEIVHAGEIAPRLLGIEIMLHVGGKAAAGWQGASQF